MSDKSDKWFNAYRSGEQEIYRLQGEVARLKEELARLRASSFVTAVPADQYERVIKAGDAMASQIEYQSELDDADWGVDTGTPEMVKAWRAAKKGQP